MRRRRVFFVGRPALLSTVAVMLGFLLATAASSAHTGAGTVSPQWEGLPFPQPATELQALAVGSRGPSTVYVGVRLRGVYKTTDGGRSWRYVGLRGKRFWSLAVHPTSPRVVYAGVSWEAGTGVATSRDAGRRWGTPVRCCGVEVFTFAFDPRDREVVYAGGDGFSKSSDGGRTWTHLETSIGGSHVNGLSVVARRPDTVYAAVGAGGGYGSRETPVQGVFRTTDAGETWRRVGLAGTAVKAVAVEQQRPWVAYASAERSVFKSHDGGRTWQPASTGLPRSLTPDSSCHATSLVLDPVRAQTLYLGTFCGVFRSTDGARTWRAFSEGLGETDTDPEVTELAISPGGRVLYAMTTSGLARRPLDAKR